MLINTITSYWKTHTNVLVNPILNELATNSWNIKRASNKFLRDRKENKIPSPKHQTSISHFYYVKVIFVGKQPNVIKPLLSYEFLMKTMSFYRFFILDINFLMTNKITYLVFSLALVIKVWISPWNSYFIVILGFVQKKIFWFWSMWILLF